MYISPNSTIELFSDIGLSGNYDNALYFSSTADKDSYFSNIGKIATLNNFSYVSQQKGIIRVGTPISNLLSAGYLRYKNTSYENKWFYAFITGIEYRSNGMTEIHFEIDYLTTWMGAFQLKQCFVERQHVTDDSIGVNILDEGINFGEHVIEGIHDYTLTGTTSFNPIVIVTAAESGGSGGGIAGGVYSGCVISVFVTAESANKYINDLIDKNKADNIVKIYSLPAKYVVPGGTPIEDRYKETHTNNKPYNTLDGYVPKNNKLFCYPYKYAEVSNGEGDKKDYKYECFNTVPGNTSSGTYSFTEQASFGASTQALFMPINYKVQSMSGNGQLEIDERVSLSSFPLCAYNIDTYRAYTAQQNTSAPNSLFNSFTKGAISGGAAGASGGILGAIGGALFGGISSSIGKVVDLLTVNTVPVEMGTRNQGTQESDFLLATKQKGFRIYEKCITKAYAKVIDDYFSAFGYAVRRTATPNMNARPHWTYVKTTDCIVEGNLPSDDARKIENIFDSGCRFWKKHTEIGNYDLDNSPS